jgi:heavy metal efflux system protein
MLNNVIAFSIKNKFIVGLFVFTLIGYGFYQITKLPIDAVPDITDNQVQVITAAPSLGAPDIERLITFPIEQATSNIPGLKEIRSFSRFGLSLITIVFEDDVDVYWARQQVTERLKIAEQQIPKGVGSPELAPVTSGLGEIYQYVLKPKPGYEAKYNTTELRTVQDWIVKRQLISVKGVADVSSFGGRVKQYEIAINPAVLKSNNITINDVFTALEKNNENTGGAYIEKASTVLYIRAEGLIGNLDDIKNIVVKNTNNGTPLLINDVAEVRIGNATRYGAITFNDEGEVAGAVVMMLKGDNSSRVIKDIKDKIEQIKKTLPEGVELEPFLDRTKMVNAAIGTVTKNLLEGALIVVLILVLFLGNLRAGVIVASVIPLSMLFAVILMNIFGVSGNLMSLGALDFGLIVDGAVIIVEACMFQLHLKGNAYNTGMLNAGIVNDDGKNAGMLNTGIVNETLTERNSNSALKHSAFSIKKSISQTEMDDMVYNTSTRMRNAAVFGELIILAVYLPIFTLQGIEGKMFIPMAQTVAFSLLGAFILSLTYIPMMTALFLSKNITHKKNISDKMMDVLENIHQKVLVKVLNIPKIMVGATVCLFLIAIFVFSKMGGEFIPELPEGDFAVDTRVLTGSNITTSSNACLQAAHILKKKFPEVEKIVGKTGSGEIPTDPMPMEASDLMIILKDKSEWTSAQSWNELSDKMSEALQDIPGVTFSFQYPVAMRFNELMTGAKQDVVCKIFGENLDSLSKYSKIVGDVAGKIKGTKNIYVEPIDGLPQLIINYKRNLIAQYGLNIQDINKVVNTALAGQSSGLVFEDEKRFDLVVRLAGENRKELSDIKNLLIPTAKGTQIPLYQVADVSIKESVNQIQRDDAKRRIIIGFNVGDRDVQSIVKDLQVEIDKIKLPTGYYVTYGGGFENLEAAKKRLSIAVPISLLLIFILLFFAFNSFKHGLLIYSAIPLSAIGGIFFLALRGMPFSISAGIGFIALFGVAVLNGIVLVSEYNRIRKEGKTDLKQIVLEGTKHRLRPVLMTAFVASLGFLPMALSNGAGAEVQRPLATVVIGGLLIATFLTLFVLPVLYVIFEKIGGKKSKIVTTILVIIFFGFQNTQAQTPISLESAIDLVVKNNLKNKNEKLNSDYLQQLTQTAYDIPNTSIGTELGQFNSNLFDTKLGLLQTIKFPSVYRKQKQLLIEEAKQGQWNEMIQKRELTRQLTNVFYEIIYLKEKEKILLKTDTIYSQFVSKSSLRLNKGESNILEKIYAENQLAQIKLQLRELQEDQKTLQSQFQYLLNTDVIYLPTTDKYKMDFVDSLDTDFISELPIIKIIEQEKNINKAKIVVEQSKKTPELTGGIFAQSFRTKSTFENSYLGAFGQLGLSFPLFNSSIKNKVKALKIGDEIIQNQVEIEKRRLQNQYQQLLQSYRKYNQTVAYYESEGLKNSTLILGIADKKFGNGDINYLEWSVLINNVTAIQSNYIDAIKELNQIIIQLYSFQNK